MFSIGDIVCYPLNGIGTIEGIEKRDVLGKTTEYYLIRLTNSKIVAMLPVENAAAVGLRHIISKETCSALYDYYKTTEPCVGNDNWNQRYRDNLDKLRTGDPYAVIDVILCLDKRSSFRTLSSGESKMLANAKNILFTEISAVSGKPIEAIEEDFKQ